MDMTGRSLIFDGFVLNFYPDYPDDISDLELPDDIVASCEEESEVIETEVDNTIKINMMAVNSSPSDLFTTSPSKYSLR